MKTDFESWVVLRKGSVPIGNFVVSGNVWEALLEVTHKMKAMGARVAEARNLSSFKGRPSLLVHDPSFPVAIIITGAQLTDKAGRPLQGEDAQTGLSALVPPISE